MKISKGKTTYILAKGVGRGTIRITDPDGDELEMKQAVKYLGVWIDKKMKFRTHCQYAADKAKNQISRFRAVARARWGLKGKDLLTIYKTIFVPISVYCAGAWFPYATKRDVNRMAAAQRAALLVVTRAYRTISGPALLVIAGVPHIRRELEKELLKQNVRKGTSVEIMGQNFDPSANEGSTFKELL